jgi:N-acetyltransferase
MKNRLNISFLPLERGNLRLRALTKHDFPVISGYIRSEPELWRFALEPVWTEAEGLKYCQDALDLVLTNSGIALIVEDVPTGKCLGSTRIYHWNTRDKSCFIGYTWYAKNEQGKGINAVCKYLLLQWLFESLGVERVEFRADERNKRSLRAMEKIGCRIEGVLREHQTIHDGSKRNTVILSILQSDWCNGIKERIVRLLP